jgi:predicted membrane protein
MANLFSKKFMKVPNTHPSHIFREIGRNAFVDWIFILLFNFVATILMLVFGLYVYWQISTGQFVSTEKKVLQEENIFNEKDLKYVTDIFKSRGDNTDMIQGGYRGASDPSL